MARLCQRPEAGDSQPRQAEICLGRAGTALWAQIRVGNQQRRLQGVPYRKKAVRQHGPDRIGNAARLPELSQNTAQYMVAPRFKAARYLAYQRASTCTYGAYRRAARSVIRDFGGNNQRQNGCAARPYMGSGKFQVGIYRPRASGQNQDEQTTDDRPDGEKGQNSLRGGLRGTFNRSRYRICREAGKERPEGPYIRFDTQRGKVQPSYLKTHGGSLDGARHGPDVANIAVHGAHHNQGYREALCPIFARVHAGSRRCFGLVKYLGTYSQINPIRCNPLKSWWAMTGSTRRHLRCKRTSFAQICQIKEVLRRYFAHLATFCSRFVAVSCTYSTCRTEKGLPSRSGPNQTEHRRFDNG